MEVEDRSIDEPSPELTLTSAAQGPRALGDAPATVPGSNPAVEVSVIGQQQWHAIHERQARGQSISAIAREFDLDRKTVRTCLAQSSWQPYLRSRPSPTQLDVHRAWLCERAPQVNFSARILHQELRAQRAFKGCYESVKVAVRPLRAAAAVAALTQCRFETAPGEQAQCDWGEVSVWMAGQRVKIHVFVMTLGYSRRGYAEGFSHERMPSLLAAHEHAFAHFGGRCEFLLYDRMRTVVLGSSEGRVRLNARFQAFAQYWGFTPRLCQPYRAQTKGKVESGVKYVKRNFVPGRTFVDIDDFNTQLSTWQADVADLRLHGTTHQRPIDRFALEAQHLAPTASQPSFLQAMVRDRVVAEDWLVSIDANRYSVPFALIGKTVQVVRAIDRWHIRHRGTLVADHPVLDGRGQLSVLPAHGPGAASRNSRQRYGSEPPRPPSADAVREVQIRDLAVYEQLAEAA